MTAVLRLFVIIVVLLSAGGAAGQSKVDPFDFLEEWDLLGQEFRNSKLELTPEGLPPGFDTDVIKPSERGHYHVSIRPRVDPIPLNRIHTWLVEIKGPDGAPVSGADVSIYGSMPLHGHGFPTVPHITGETDKGVYTLEGMKFSMTGWWTLGVGYCHGGDK